MKCVYIILSILLLFSCVNNSKRENTNIYLPIEDTIVAQEALDSNLVEGVLKLIERQNYLQFPEIPMEESFIVMFFWIDTRERDGVVLSDSTVRIFHFDYFFPIYPEDREYKGMLNIAGYNVAIFDIGNFGGKFFNIDSLRQVPLDGFKRFPIKNTTTERFRVCNGKLKYTGWSVSVGGDPENSRVI
jgi:hypothetical protein